jgi:uncharacterized protein (DUF885 family)
MEITSRNIQDFFLIEEETMHSRRIFSLLTVLSIFLAGCDLTKQDLKTSPTEAPSGAQVVNGTSTELPTEVIPLKEATESFKNNLLNLQGLPIEDFFEEAYELILSRDPEVVIELGLHQIELESKQLTNVSPSYLEGTKELLTGLMEVADSYEFNSLDATEQISMLVFKWYLEDRVEEIEQIHYSYPVTNFGIRSIPQLAIMFFTDTLPLNTPEDAEAYVEMLRFLDEKIFQVMERLEVNSEHGIIPPKIILQKARLDIKNQLRFAAESSPLYLHFADKLKDIGGLDQNQKDDLLAEVLTFLNTEVFPAFDQLDILLQELEDDAPFQIGLDQFDGGAEYYQYILDHFTTSKLSAEEIHQQGLEELERVNAEMREIFIALGYEGEQEIPALFNLMIQDSGTMSGADIADEFRRILAEAEANLDAYFDLRPSTPLEVVGGEVGAFYSPGALDGSRPGQFYARSVGTQATYKFKTIAYHEGIPGHHYQIAIAQESDLPLFRNVLIFDGYAEGWALYGEYLAWELGWYEDDPYGNLGRLQYEALRAARMVVDTGIHSKGWTYEQAISFLVENTGIPEGHAQWEVERYIAYPGQAPAYTVGKFAIQRLRQNAMDVLGDKFDIKEFHNIILKNGSVPLEILQIIVEKWIDQTQNPAS